MRRREFIAVGFAAWPLASSSSAQVRRPRLAMLVVAAGTETTERLAALAELGWVDGHTIDIIMRSAEGDLDRVPALIAELVALEPDIILTHTGTAARAAAEATRTIPVVVGAAQEEVLVELAGSLVRPTGNVTGLTLVSHEQHAKVLKLLKQAHPAAARIGILANPLNVGSRDYPTPLAGALGVLGLNAIRVEARDQDGLDAAFATMAAARADAVLIAADPNFNRPAMHRRFNELARAQRIAVVSTFDAFTREGGLLSLGTDYRVIFRRAAVYVDKILKGAKTGDLPIERPTVFRLIVNLKTAKALGLTLPETLLARADEVIE